MSRRHRAEKREIEPDPVYKSTLLAKFINKVMMGGKKSVARAIVYAALDDFAAKVKRDTPLEAFEEALENAKPQVEVKSRRIGGATYQVPVEIPPSRRISMAMGWIIQYSRSKSWTFNAKRSCTRACRLPEQPGNYNQEKRGHPQNG